MQISSGSWHASFFSFKVVPLSAWTGLRRFLRLRHRKKRVISRNTTDCSLCFTGSGDCDERNVCMWYWWSPCTKNFLCLCVFWKEGVLIPSCLRNISPAICMKCFTSIPCRRKKQTMLTRSISRVSSERIIPVTQWSTVPYAGKKDRTAQTSGLVVAIFQHY